MGGSSPLVSVVVPAYNAAPYLRELCLSLQAQTYQNFEVLIGDDGSTDNSAEVVAPFLGDARFRFWRWERNRGVNSGTVALLAEAKGKYWAYPGADDVLEAFFLEHRVALMERDRQVGVIHGQPSIIDQAGAPKEFDPRQFPAPKRKGCEPVSILPAREALRILLQHNWVITPSVVVRMSVTKTVLPHMMTPWCYAQDWAYWLLHAAAGFDFAYDCRPLVRYRVHAASLTNDPAKQALRQAEIRLIPLCTLSQAAQFSAEARELWSRWGKALYALWLRRALVLSRSGCLKDDWVLAGDRAYHGTRSSRSNLWAELIRHGFSVLRFSWQEKRLRENQSIRVSGLSLIDHPAFRRP